MMGTTRKRTGTTAKKTPAKRTVRKKKPKVQLKTKSVVIMASSIIAVCILILGVTFLLSRASSSEMSQTAWKKAPAGQPVSEEEIKDVPLKSDDPPKTKQAESTWAKGIKTDNGVKQDETRQPDKKTETKDEPKQEIVIIPPKETQVSQSEQKKPVQESQEKNQSKTEKKEQSGQKLQTQSSQKNVIQQQEKIASVTVNQQPQIQEIPKKLFDVPQAKPGTRICFVIDDAGANLGNLKRYTSLPFPITIAVLPKLAQSSECAQAVRSSGKELILHQPMQAHDYTSGTTPNPGPGAILPDMSTFEIAQTVKENLDSLGGGVKGINNHEGSLITENFIKMNAVFEVAVERGIYFLDSRTTSSSSVPQVAMEHDTVYLARYAPFLDNEISRSSMLEMIYKGLETANKNGYAVMIGHVDKSVNVLPQLLSDIYPYLVQAGYTVTVPSRL
ncbi:MAG: divergent polysaccharide deacetylase family protein [Treponema sp.]|nr:divergent polysaccharide deacetylase family protein [Treponema sp.]